MRTGRLAIRDARLAVVRGRVADVNTDDARARIVVGVFIRVEIERLGAERILAYFGHHGILECLARPQFQRATVKAVRAAIGNQHARAQREILCAGRQVEGGARTAERHADAGDEFLDRDAARIARAKRVMAQGARADGGHARIQLLAVAQIALEAERRLDIELVPVGMKIEAGIARRRIRQLPEQIALACHLHARFDGTRHLPVGADGRLDGGAPGHFLFQAALAIGIELAGGAAGGAPAQHRQHHRSAYQEHRLHCHRYPLRWLTVNLSECYQRCSCCKASYRAVRPR